MTDTPRTDAAYDYTSDEWRSAMRLVDGEEHPAPFNRYVAVVVQARRELAAMTKERDALRGMDAAGNDAYQELRDERDALRDLLRDWISVCDSEYHRTSLVVPLVKMSRAALEGK